MKKRLLATIMALAMVVTAVTPQIFATVDETQSSTANENVTTNVKYSQTSNFSVIVPKIITLDADKTSSYTVDVNGDIASDVKVVVVPDETVTMKDVNSIKADVTGIIEQDKTEWLYNEMDANAKGLVSAKGLTAGTWKGIFYFNINMTSNVSESNLTLSADEDMFMGSGEQNQVNAYINGVEANDQVTWVSDNAKIQVNNGLITTSATAEAGDTATITVTAKSQETASTYARTFSNLRAANNEDVSIEFQVTVVDITYNIEDIEIAPDDSATVTAKVIPEELNGVVRWTQTAVSGISLSKNGNTVTINVSSDMPAGRTYQLIASYGDFSKPLNIKIVDNQVPHTHTYTSTITKAATCEEDGLKTFTCVDGDDTYTQVIPATGHNYGDWTVVKAATCTENGTEEHICENCGHKESREIKAHGHKEVTVTGKPATCTKDGLTYGIVCDDCGKVIKAQEIIPATGHNYENGKCTNCGVTQEAGLYDKDGNLLCTWEESGIDVEKDYSYSSSNSNYYKTSKTSGYYVLTMKYPTATKVVTPDDITNIGDYAFRDCVNLTSVTIPSSVTSIGQSAFYGCASLTSVTIPDSVTSIGDSAFCDCRSLTSVTIPDSVTSIGKYAFYNCASLTSVTIPSSVTSIGSSTFYGCASLTSVTIPSSVTNIGYDAFAKCSSLTSVTIPDSVTSIGKYAFRACTNLTSVTFKTTSGWYVGDTEGAKTTALSSSDLANTSTAVTYLKSTYLLKYWTRK